MIKAKINNRSNIITFICPGCGEEDIAYMTMPEYCYKCGEVYNFLIHRMVEYYSDRRYYHFSKK